MMNKKLIVGLIKVVLLAISLGYITHKIYQEIIAGEFSVQIQAIEKIRYGLLVIAIVLLVINWTLEALKWKILLSIIENISLKKSIKAVFSGITISIFTPNRIGEFGGRIFFLSPENRTKGIFATLVGNLAQLATTLLVGLLFFPFFIEFTDQLLPGFNNFTFFLVIAVVILGCLCVYFWVPKWVVALNKVKRLKKWMPYVLFIKNYRLGKLLVVLGFSLLRYLVFVSQYYLIIKAFAIELNYYEVFICASQIYLLMALIPTFALSEIGVRGSVAIFIFGYITTATLAILSASFLLWIINLAIPALIGSVFIVKLKV